MPDGLQCKKDANQLRAPLERSPTMWPGILAIRCSLTRIQSIREEFVVYYLGSFRMLLQATRFLLFTETIS